MKRKTTGKQQAVVIRLGSNTQLKNIMLVCKEADDRALGIDVQDLFVKEGRAFGAWLASNVVYQFVDGMVAALRESEDAQDKLNDASANKGNR